MWDQILLDDVTVTGVALEGWNAKLSLTNSHFTGTTKKIQNGGGGLQIDVDANSSLTLTLGTDNGDPGAHVFNSYGTTSLVLATPHFHNTSGSNVITLGTTGTFSIASSSSTSYTGVQNFTVNATLGDTATGTLLESGVYKRDLLTFEKFSTSGVVDVSLAGTEGWTLVGSLDELQNMTTVGKYYFVDKAASSGASLYTRDVIPEPSAATLSLLALAGITARRRRK